MIVVSCFFVFTVNGCGVIQWHSHCMCYYSAQCGNRQLLCQLLPSHFHMRHSTPSPFLSSMETAMPSSCFFSCHPPLSALLCHLSPPFTPCLAFTYSASAAQDGTGRLLIQQYDRMTCMQMHTDMQTFHLSDFHALTSVWMKATEERLSLLFFFLLNMPYLFQLPRSFAKEQSSHLTHLHVDVCVFNHEHGHMQARKFPCMLALVCNYADTLRNAFARLIQHRAPLLWQMASVQTWAIRQPV